MPLKHRFVSNKPDGPDTSLVRPSNWNEDHKVEPGITGSVLFVGENQSVSEDNANLFWDNVNKRLGIGTSSPAAALHVVGRVRVYEEISTVPEDIFQISVSSLSVSSHAAGLRIDVTFNPTADNLALRALTGTVRTASNNTRNILLMRGMDYASHHSGLGTVAELTGILTYTVNRGPGNVTNMYGAWFRQGEASTGSGVISNLYGVYVENFKSGTGVINNAYGIYIANVNQGSALNYAIYSVGGRVYFGGDVGIGASAPEFKLDVRGHSCVNRVADADSTNTLRNSFNLVLRAAYWTGSASANRDAVIFHRVLSTAPTSEIAFQIAGVDLAMLRDAIADGETALLIRRNVGGTYSVVRVSMGPPDSGGTGYRVLRVPN
ncbi:MAG: hypothetical protein QW692_04485 [Nitrososphaerota archaeon]